MSCARTVARALLVAAALGSTAHCTKLPYEPVQILVVEVATQGSGVDGDGYVATIDDVMSQPVAANGSATFEGLGAGERTLAIGGLAPNCAVDGPNPRPLFIEEDAITRVNVSVVCSPSSGLLIVEVGTTGTTLDPDGYTVSVDDSPARPVGNNGSVTFEGLSPGEHVVSLTNIADNCRLEVGEPNPRTVTVASDVATRTRFQLQCGPVGGVLVVVAATTGTDLDADGYAISLDEGDPSPIEPNGALTFTNLGGGDHVVTIDGIASNCGLAEGSRSRTVTIPPNGSTTETFFVHCGPPAGALVVDVTTTGTDVDSDGYMVSASSTEPGGPTVSRAVGTNGSATFEALASGDYRVELSGVAGNCEVVVDETPNPRTITLTPGASSTTTFFVHCQPVAGALVVDVSTVGTAPRPDSYLILVDGTRGKRISPNGAVLYEALLAAEEHSVRIADVAEGCIVDGANPRVVDIDPGASTRASLTVRCGTVGSGALRIDVTTAGSDPDPDGYALVVNDGPPTPVAPNGSLTFADLPPGEYTIRIEGLADNCVLTDGPASRDASVSPSALTVVGFAVNCEEAAHPATGTLMVKTRTSGPSPDPDGYLITLDDDRVSRVGTNQRLVLEVEAGEHTVEISDVAAQCSLDGPPRRTVLVPAGGLDVEWFFLECRLP